MSRTAPPAGDARPVFQSDRAGAVVRLAATGAGRQPGIGVRLVPGRPVVRVWRGRRGRRRRRRDGAEAAGRCYDRGVNERDSAWYERARGGDAAALAQLIEGYLPQLHAFVRVRLGGRVRDRESSMDIVQSACRELLADPSRHEFRGEDRFRGWLFTTALNKLREKHRFHGREKRRPEREVEGDVDALLPVAGLLTPSVDAIGRETALALDGAMQALSEEHREVITMARIAQLPHAVIAELLGRSEEAVRQLLVRALRRLAAELRSRGIGSD
jgi:RNA polymerase sigma-70 factor (ECF subfamily)